MTFVPFPRNPHNRTVSIRIDAELYDAFREATKEYATKDAIERVVRWFLSLPKDAREIILADVSDEARAAVLRIVLRRMRKKR